MVELPGPLFGLHLKRIFPIRFRAPPGSKSPLWYCAACTSYKILGFLGPRDCTGDRTGIWCFCAAGCTQPSCQFMQLGQPSRCWRCDSASTRPRPPPTTSSGGSIGRFAAGAVPGRVAHTCTESTLSLSNLHRCGMLCTYVYLRIDIDLSTPSLRDEHNSHANSMQQMLQNSSENELIVLRPPLIIPTSLRSPAQLRENLHAHASRN